MTATLPTVPGARACSIQQSPALASTLMGFDVSSIVNYNGFMMTTTDCCFCFASHKSFTHHATNMGIKGSSQITIDAYVDRLNVKLSKALSWGLGAVVCDSHVIYVERCLWLSIAQIPVRHLPSLLTLSSFSVQCHNELFFRIAKVHCAANYGVGGQIEFHCDYEHKQKQG